MRGARELGIAMAKPWPKPSSHARAHALLLTTGLAAAAAANPPLHARNAAMKAFLLRQEPLKALQAYRGLLLDGLRPDDYTLPYALKACAAAALAGHPRNGKAVHAHVVKLGFCGHLFLNNVLVLMYLSCGSVGHARKVFDGMRHKNRSSWTVAISGYLKLGEVGEARALFDAAPEKDMGIWGAMISGYVKNNCFKEALVMFRLMQADGLEPDEGILVSTLSACAQLGAIDLGSWVHRYLSRTGLPLSVRVLTALIDMYAKCGNLGLARKLFDDVPWKDVVCWNVMILGLALHGDGEGAIELFRSMQREGRKPDDATFVAVLAACRHSGMVEEGIKLFHSMRTVYRIEPRSEHYGCVIGFLGQAGRLEDALGIIRRMPESSSLSEKAIAWRSLLSSCRNLGQTEIAEVAANQLFQLEVHSGAYVLLSNTYDNHGKHDDARRLRKDMRDRGVPKAPGCSSIELAGRVHEFVAQEQTHPQMEEIYALLDEMNNHLAWPYF